MKLGLSPGPATSAKLGFMPPVFAATDIGSNTVHLLVAQVGERAVMRLRNESEWLSLGEIVSRQGEIPDGLERLLISTLKRYRAIAETHRAKHFYVFATEAMRMARNHRDVMARINRHLGVEVDLISPRREAELGIAGVQIDCPSSGPMAVLEVGGGSAQVARCDSDRAITHEYSLPIGTGRLTAEVGLKQPANSEGVATLGRLVADAAEPCRQIPSVDRVVASGGVARGVWRALHPDGARLIHREELAYLQWSSARLTTAEICMRFGVKSKRADTLLPGSTVFIGLLDALGHEEMVVSEFGVREGAVFEMAKGKIERCRQ